MYLRCTHFFFFRLLVANKQRPVETWEKYQKLCHYPHTPFSRKGREASWQKVPVHRPNKTQLWSYTFFDSLSSKTTCKNSKFLFRFKFTANHTDFMQFTTKFIHLSFNAFRLLTIGRELHKK